MNVMDALEYHIDKNKYLYHITINREIKLNHKIKEINDGVVEIVPKLNSILETKGWIDFNGKKSCKYIGDFTFKGTIVLEYIREDNKIGMIKQEILEEEYIKLPYRISSQRVIGKVTNIYVYKKSSNEVYISVYFLLKMDY